MFGFIGSIHYFFILNTLILLIYFTSFWEVFLTF